MMGVRGLLLGFVSMVITAACATSAIVDTPTDPETGAPQPTSDASCSFCGNTCVDLKTDGNNCGKCGTVCPMGATCIQGSCQCASGQTKCGNLCVDTKSDTKNCGKCGTVCGGDGGTVSGGGTWGCTNGACTIMCPPPKIECSGACVDTKTDNDNCGMCGNACVQMTEQCTDGQCCKVGEVLCSMKCTDTKTDPQNCGMCGKTCGGNTPACSNGVCIAALVYSKMFTQGQPPPQQHCTDWNTYRASLNGNYSSITVRGSNDMVGKTCTGMMANQLCNALRTGQATNVMCNGQAWYVGTCTMGIEVSANGQCSCTSQYSLRPCINHQDWGGVKTTSCNAPSQTMEVVCQ